MKVQPAVDWVLFNIVGRVLGRLYVIRMAIRDARRTKRQIEEVRKRYQALKPTDAKVVPLHYELPRKH